MLRNAAAGHLPFQRLDEEVPKVESLQQLSFQSCAPARFDAEIIALGKESSYWELRQSKTDLLSSDHNDALYIVRLCVRKLVVVSKPMSEIASCGCVCDRELHFSKPDPPVRISLSSSSITW